METYIIYHNPRCSKSRQTLSILDENDVNIKIIKYLADPPTAKELNNISKKLGVPPMDFIRKNEAEFTELGLNQYNDSDSKLYEIMSKNPKLIERPIVIKGERAVIGRPPENVMELFEK